MEAIKMEAMESQNQTSLQSEQSNKGTTFLRTCFNGLNILAGVGILSIPYALSEGGWVGLILLLIVAILCWYTGLLLHRCMEANPLVRSYADIGGLAFGFKGKTLVSVFMYLELYLAAVGFLILEGDTLEKLFPDCSIFAGMKLSSKQGFIILTAVVVLPTTWLRNLGSLAYVSAGGVLASIIVVCSVFWVGAVDGVGFHEKGVLFNWSGLATAISLYVFCYCGHSVFPTLSNSMKDRSQFPKVLFVCFVLSSVSYGSMAILGYLMYGETIMSQVTLNLPTRKISSQIAIYTTLINPLTKYALIITPIAIAIEERLPFKNPSRLVGVVFRTVLVLSTVIVALIVPFFGYVLAFTGAFLSVAVSILFPCLFYVKLNGPSRRFGLELIILALILAVGCLFAVMGTYTSIRNIVSELMRG
ncbi:hypothetical protein Ancab_020721 [Ancistrocladus abbreviatus]